MAAVIKAREGYTKYQAIPMLEFVQESQYCIQCTILAISIYAVKKKGDLLTKNMQITTLKQLITWYDLPEPQSRHLSF